MKKHWKQYAGTNFWSRHVFLHDLEVEPAATSGMFSWLVRDEFGTCARGTAEDETAAITAAETEMKRMLQETIDELNET